MLQVLIVEDEEIIRRGLELSIAWLSMGCHIIATAENGREGLRCIRTLQPDLVLTDIKMPYMDGLSMIKEGQKYCSFSSIILTSYAEFQLAKEALHLGAVEYLLKPVDEEELQLTVAKIKEKREQDAQDRIHLLHQGILRNMPLGAKLAGTENPYISRLFEIIRKEYASKLMMQEVSARLGVSASYLSRKLKEKLNTSFTELLNEYRIELAIQRLKEGGSRVYEISEELGFGDYRSFIRCFKRYVGVTPTEFCARLGQK